MRRLWWRAGAAATIGHVLVGAVVSGAVAGIWGARLVARWGGLGCRSRVPAAVAGAAAVGLAWGAVAVRAGALPPWWWPVPVVLGWAGVVLAATDLAVRRLPDVLTLPGYPVVAVLLGVAAIGAADPAMPGRAAAGAVLWAGGYAACRLISPSALGGGDVKLAGPLGAITAAVSWAGLLVAVLAATALTAVHALAARLVAGRRDVPHGPAMVIAAWLVALGGPG